MTEKTFLRKPFTLLVAFLAISLVSSAQALPTFSTDGAETWYLIQFRNGEAALQDQGEGANLVTAGIDKSNEAQLWKLTGTQNNCEIVSKAGRHIYYNGSRFAASASQTGQLKLAATTNATYKPAWEIQATAVSGNNMAYVVNVVETRDGQATDNLMLEKNYLQNAVLGRERNENTLLSYLINQTKVLDNRVRFYQK